MLSSPVHDPVASKVTALLLAGPLLRSFSNSVVRRSMKKGKRLAPSLLGFGFASSDFGVFGLARGSAGAGEAGAAAAGDGTGDAAGGEGADFAAEDFAGEDCGVTFCTRAINTDAD